METKEELLRIIDLLNDTYESEQAWHGPSVVEVLREVSPKLANKRISPATHTIAELVFHMTTWRIFVVRKLQGDTSFDIMTKEKNWKTFPQFDEFEWETLQMELSLSQEELISELEKQTSDEFLDQIVPGRTYSFYTMLHGVVHHDLYHGGQIASLRKALSLEALDNDNLEDFQDSDTFGENFGQYN